MLALDLPVPHIARNIDSVQGEVRQPTNHVNSKVNNTTNGVQWQQEGVIRHDIVQPGVVVNGEDIRVPCHLNALDVGSLDWLLDVHTR